VFQSLNEEEDVRRLLQFMDKGDLRDSSSLFSISSQSLGDPLEIKSFLSSAQQVEAQHEFKIKAAMDEYDSRLGHLQGNDVEYRMRRLKKLVQGDLAFCPICNLPY